MTRPRKTVRNAGTELAQERLAAYQRYAELVQAQEAALEQGDLEGFDQLSRAAQELQSGLGLATAALSRGETGAPVSYVEKVTELLRGALVSNERIQRRLGELRQHTSDDIRRGDAARPRIRSYINGAGVGDKHSLDLKS